MYGQHPIVDIKRHVVLFSIIRIMKSVNTVDIIMMDELS